MSFVYNSSGKVFSATVASNATSVTSDYHALGHSLGTTVWLPGGGRLSRAVGRSIFATDRVFSVANRHDDLSCHHRRRHPLRPHRLPDRLDIPCGRGVGKPRPHGIVEWNTCGRKELES